MAVKLKSVLLLLMCIGLISSASVHNTLPTSRDPEIKAEIRNIKSIVEFNEYVMSIKDTFAVDLNDPSNRKRLSDITKLSLLDTKTEKIRHCCSNRFHVF